MAKRLHAKAKALPTKRHGCSKCGTHKNVETLRRKGGRLYTLCGKCKGSRKDYEPPKREYSSVEVVNEHARTLSW